MSGDAFGVFELKGVGEVFHGFASENAGSYEHYFFNDVAIIRFRISKQGASGTYAQ